MKRKPFWYIYINYFIQTSKVEFLVTDHNKEKEDVENGGNMRRETLDIFIARPPRKNSYISQKLNDPKLIEVVLQYGTFRGRPKKKFGQKSEMSDSVETPPPPSKVRHTFKKYFYCIF